jgi:CheY-like chemotaxis protein
MAKRILVIDDEPDMVAIMKLTLETNGFQTITAYDGMEGLEKAKKEKPDLIILDVLMPKIFGDELSLRLNQDPDTLGIPVILLTNVPLNYLTPKEKEEYEFVRDARGNILLPKYCEEEELMAAINQVLA